jgi:UDP-N-acetylglucosamine--dolichyl-phosphate N-acetylglucosaminephosphotransferase
MALAPRQYLVALSAVGWIGPLIAFFQIKDPNVSYSIVISACISGIGFFATKASIPIIKRRTLRAGLSGKDINKKGSKEGEKDVPESLGLAPGVVFLVCFVFWSIT